MKLISIVVPCYNEEESIPSFYKECINVIKKIKNVKYEIIFVNDGSKDNTLNILKKYSKIDSNVKYISFSRNFGKEAAMLAGLKYANGDYITLMDADLQDPPHLLIEMYSKIQKEKVDCVIARRKNRIGEPKIRSFFARKFYTIISKMAKLSIADGERDFRLMTRQLLDSILELNEYNRFFKGLFSYVGYNVEYIEYSNVLRKNGKTKWSFFSLLKYGIEGIVSFSTMPLIISTFIGLIFFIISVIFVIVIFVKTLIYGDPVAGWPSLACIILFSSGIQLLCFGIMGEYLAKLYLETKSRPIYIVKETNINR